MVCGRLEGLFHVCCQTGDGFQEGSAGNPEWITGNFTVAHLLDRGGTAKYTHSSKISRKTGGESTWFGGFVVVDK